MIGVWERGLATAQGHFTHYELVSRLRISSKLEMGYYISAPETGVAILCSPISKVFRDRHPRADSYHVSWTTVPIIPRSVWPKASLANTFLRPSK